MKFRSVQIYDGTQHQVPRHVCRIDGDGKHAWQVRFAGTKLFSDSAFKGAAAALAAASEELARRMQSASNTGPLKAVAAASKSSDLPVGIYGPNVRTAKSGAREAYLVVSRPQFAGPAKRTTVYIGREGAYSQAQFDRALAKAMDLRRAAETKYQAAADAEARNVGTALAGRAL